MVAPVFTCPHCNCSLPTTVASPLVERAITPLWVFIARDGDFADHASYNAARHAVIALGIMQGLGPRNMLVDWEYEADEAGVVIVDPKTGEPVCVDWTPLETDDNDDDGASDEANLRWLDRRFGENAPRYQAPPRETSGKERMALTITIARARVATLALGLGMIAVPKPANDNKPHCPTCGADHRS